MSSVVAIGVANGFARNSSGGPWSLAFVSGIASTVMHPDSLTGFALSETGCNVSGTANYTEPGYTGNYSSGQFPTWVVDYYNVTGELQVAVVNGQVAAHVATWGGSCLPQRQPFVYRTIPSSVVSSTIAASVGLRDQNVSMFVANHVSAEADVFLSPWSPESSLGPVLTWTFEYFSCSRYFTPGTPALGSFVAVHLNASQGTLDSGGTYYLPQDPCVSYWGGSVPPSNLFSMGQPELGRCPSGFTFAANGCLAGDHTYSLPITTSYLTFEWLNLEVWGQSPPGGFYNLTSPGGFSILAPNGTVAAQSYFPAGMVMRMSYGFRVVNPGNTMGDLVPATDAVLLDMGNTNPAGMGLTLAARDPYSTATTPPVALP